MRLRFFLRGVVSAILSPSPSPNRRFCLRVGICVPAKVDSAHAIAKHLLAVARRSMYLPLTAGVQFMAVQCCSRWFFWCLGISSQQCLHKLFGFVYRLLRLSDDCFIRPVTFNIFIFSSRSRVRGLARCLIVSRGIA